MLNLNTFLILFIFPWTHFLISGIQILAISPAKAGIGCLRIIRILNWSFNLLYCKRRPKLRYFRSFKLRCFSLLLKQTLSFASQESLKFIISVYLSWLWFLVFNQSRVLKFNNLLFSNQLWRLTLFVMILNNSGFWDFEPGQNSPIHFTKGSLKVRIRSRKWEIRDALFLRVFIFISDYCFKLFIDGYIAFMLNIWNLNWSVDYFALFYFCLTSTAIQSRCC